MMPSDKIEPEYKTWSLEKLQDEYFSLKLHHSALKAREHDAKAAQEEVTDLARAFKRFLDRVEEV